MIKEILIQLPTFFTISCFILWTVTGDIEFGKFIAVYIGNILINNFLKKSLKLISNNASWARRPKGAYNCKSIVTPGRRILSKSSGMPSGHSQAAGFLMTYSIIMIWKKSNMEKHFKILSTIFVSIIGLLIALHRADTPVIGINCHTRLQVIIGFLIGCGLGVAGYVIAHPKDKLI